MNDSHSHSKYKATQYTSCKHRAANTHIQSNAFAFKTAVFVSLMDSEGPIQKQMAKKTFSVLADDDASGGVKTDQRRTACRNFQHLIMYFYYIALKFTCFIPAAQYCQNQEHPSTE